MSSPYTVCVYIGRKGYCGKRCFGGRCNIHRKRETLVLCLEECGRGTASVTGYCHQCGYKQMTVWRQRKVEAQRLDTFIDEAGIGSSRNAKRPQPFLLRRVFRVDNGALVPRKPLQKS